MANCDGIQRPMSIPEPVNKLDSLWRTAQALKEAVEMMQGIRGNREYALKCELEDLSDRVDSNTGSTQQITKSWPFISPAGASGTYYFGGFYEFHSTAFVPAGGTIIGTANTAYAAHALLVIGANSINMIVRVAGTSITDNGVRTASDFEDINTSGGGANKYFETDKKWIGQVTYSLQSGTGVSINAGWAKYWDYNNTNYTIYGLETLWLAGANDTGANIELLHHKTTGWTYGAGGTPTTPTPIASMNTDHVTEIKLSNGEYGAWKRSNLKKLILGTQSEGALWRVTTTANKAIEIGNLQFKII